MAQLSPLGSTTSTRTEAAKETSLRLLHGQSLGAATATWRVRRSCRSRNPLSHSSKKVKKSNLGGEQGALREKEGRQAEMKISGDSHARRNVQERGQCIFKRSSKRLINTVRLPLAMKLAGQLICISRHTMGQPPGPDQALLHRPQAEPRHC